MNKKTAIVYDWMDSWGGVERVLLTLHEMFPKADWYTSVFDYKRAEWAKELQPRTSFIEKLPNFIKNSRKLSTPLYPLAFESFDFSNYDLVISISSSFAKGIITRPPTKHINICLTPTRFLWSHEDNYQKPLFTNLIIKHLKRWDKIAAKRPDNIIAISKTVQKRIKNVYNLDSKVVYPPFDIEYWRNVKSETYRRHPEQSEGSQWDSSFVTQNDKNKRFKFYLVVSRLEPYKKVDLVVETFKRLIDQKLIIVGNGSEQKILKSIACSNVSFVENVNDEGLGKLYSQAQALIMPQEEDFGLVSLEAQFFGCPVITYGKGGATETVLDGKTGIFFDSQTEKSLSSALEIFEKEAYNLRQSTMSEGQVNVKRFSRKIFEINFMNLINEI